MVLQMQQTCAMAMLLILKLGVHFALCDVRLLRAKPALAKNDVL